MRRRWIGLMGLIIVLVLALGGRETVTAAQRVQSATLPRTVLITRQLQTSLPCTLSGVPARSKGRIDLTWTCSSNSLSGLKGWFLVERTNRNDSVITLSRCKQPVAKSNSYSCSDTGLTSRTFYQYQLCLVATSSASGCATNNRSTTVNVRAP